MMLVWQWRELMNKYILTKRQVVNELSTFYSFLLGFLIALMIGSIILLIQDKNPFDTFSLMFKLSIGSVNSLSSSLNKATPLILAGLGIAIINTVKLWNIGAEGQIFMGAIAVNLIYINFQLTNSTSFIFVLLVFAKKAFLSIFFLTISSSFADSHNIKNDGFLSKKFNVTEISKISVSICIGGMGFYWFIDRVIGIFL